MGIPKFFRFFSNQELFKPTIIRQVPDNVDIFAIDANGIIHENINKVFYPQDNPNPSLIVSQNELYDKKYRAFNGIFKDIVGLTSVVRPRVSLLIHIDGVAPQAKINQQRNRRYKGASDRKPTDIFDRNSITPGTDFMRELDVFLRDQFKDVEQKSSMYPGVYYLPQNIIYSSYLVPGEGEHKIADHLRSLTARGLTAVIHGMDADLIMIYLMLLNMDWNNIFLFRNHKSSYEVDAMIDLKMLKGIITQLFPGVENPVDDFVTILFILGNDFLPHFPVFERVDDALNTLIGGYSQYVIQNPGLGITTISGINWLNFSRFLEFITVNYNDALLKKWGQNEDNLIRFPSMVAQRCLTQTQQISGTHSQCVRTFDVEKFNSYWYVFIFSPKNGKGVVTPIEQDINDIIGNYLEGVAWVYNYYRYGVSNVNVGWYYAYHYAPLLSDLHVYINGLYQIGRGATWENNPIHLNSEFVSPLEQLAMVLPPKSLLSIPEPLRILLSEQSPIYDIYPDSFLVDTQGKMEDWQGIAILPIPNPNRVIRAIASLNLPLEYTAQFDPIEPYVINRDITRGFRITGGGRGGSRGGSSSTRGSRGGSSSTRGSRGGSSSTRGSRGGSSSTRGGSREGSSSTRGSRGGSSSTRGSREGSSSTRGSRGGSSSTRGDSRGGSSSTRGDSRGGSSSTRGSRGGNSPRGGSRGGHGREMEYREVNTVVTPILNSTSAAFRNTLK
jgi:5'-3' exoribonuclease 1